MDVVAEGVVDAANEHNPFRNVVGFEASDAGWAGRWRCGCGGRYAYDPKQRAQVCTGTVRWRLWADGRYEEVRSPSCGGVERGPLIDPGADGGRRLNAYNPLYHLNDWITRLRGTEETEIPPRFLRLLRAELLAQYVRPEEATLEDVRLAMEAITRYRINCRCMYEHAIKIVGLLRGAPCLEITAEEADRIRARFRQYVAAYRRVPGTVKNGRSSLIEYSFVIYIICLIESYHHILPWLPIVRSMNILTDYNAIIEEICRMCGWPRVVFSPSSLWRET